MSNYIYDMPRHKILQKPLTDKCIVLDLDLTLLSTQEDTCSLKDLNIFTDPRLMELRKRIYYLNLEDLEKPGIGSNWDFYGVTRPHLQEFLIFCFNYFSVLCVWSAGKAPYVHNIVDHLFKDINYPHVVFTYDDVEMHNGNVRKPLSKMFGSNPILLDYMNHKNTLALDDNPGTFHYNIGNGVLIKPFEPECNVSSFLQNDNALKDFMDWLMKPEVINSQDVRTLDKTKIFKQ